MGELSVFCGAEVRELHTCLTPVLREVLQSLSVSNKSAATPLSPSASSSSSSCVATTSAPYSILTSDDCRQLLAGDYERDVCQCMSTPTGTEDVVSGGKILYGYPRHSMCDRLSLSLSYWAKRGRSPVSDLPTMFLLNEEPMIIFRNQRLVKVSPWIEKLNQWDHCSPDERKYLAHDILKELELRVVLDLLGVRHTVGSVTALPPSRDKLLAAFNKPHSPASGSKLTVGARALSKHHHRDKTSSWWGTSTGSEVKKNQHAVTVVERILDNCTWINIHILPHDVQVVEVRMEEGYGARWLLDGTQFRGFLEPQMIDGHSVHWRH